MSEIKTIRFAIINDDDRLCKVGSSNRPATFATLDNAVKVFDGIYGSKRIVSVHYEEMSAYEVFKGYDEESGMVPATSAAHMKSLDEIGKEWDL
jgi:hypothetical protein